MFSLFKKKQKPDKPAPVVLPRIKHKNFISAIDSIPGMTEASRPIVEPLVGDLLLTYAIDIGPSYVSVTSKSLDDYGLSRSALRQLAEENGLQAMRQLQAGTDGTIHELAAPDNMTACTILYPGLWRQIEQELGEPVVAAFPHRDVALYARATSEGTAALTAALAKVNFDDNHALSKLLYRFASDGWQVVAP